MSDKKIAMCGCHETGWFLIHDLLEEGIKIHYFITLTKAQAKQEKVSGYRDFTDLARKYDIPVYTPKKYSLKSDQDISFFQEHQFDLIISGGWQRLYPKEILDTLSIGAVVGHGSPDFLPKGRGRSPLNWAIIENRSRFILHQMVVKAGVDDGDVFDFEVFDITPFDDIRTLYYKIKILSKRMLLRSLPGLLEGALVLRPQRGEPSYYPKRSPEDGRIDWENMDVWEIHNFIRAQTQPYPGAFARLKDADYTIWKARVFDTRITYPDAAYGDIVEHFDDRLVVNCRGGLLLIDDYQRV